MNQRISSHFDGGAITVVDTARVEDLQVALRPDSHADIRPWFYFRLQGAAGRAARIRIVNAGQATYVDGWQGYSAVASYDRDTWFRVPTKFDGTELVIEHAPLRDSVYYAYFETHFWGGGPRARARGRAWVRLARAAPR